MPSLHLLSFADRRYRGSLARIRGEAGRLGLFASVHALDDRALGDDYWRVHRDTVRAHRRGFGLWTWKPYLVRRTLATLPSGDVLLYCDAGCSLNAEGRQRLADYVDLAAGHSTGGLAFRLDGDVEAWTKRAALVAGRCDDPATRHERMVAATAVLFVRGTPIERLVAEWEAAMADVALVDDTPSPQGEHPGFVAHRHDQSLFTLAALRHGLQTIPDETWWDGAWDRSRQHPIHARRWRHRLPWTQAWMRRGGWPRW